MGLSLSVMPLACSFERPGDHRIMIRYNETVEAILRLPQNYNIAAG